MSRWQDDFYSHMIQAYPDLERGESARETGRKHIPTRIFKQAVNLTRQAQRLETVLSGINPINATKKREEVLSLLEKFFPEMEDFESALKKYKTGFTRLEKENAALAKRARAGDEKKIKTQLERGKLESELRELRRIVDAIPEDLKRQIQTAQRGQTGRQR